MPTRKSPFVAFLAHIFLGLVTLLTPTGAQAMVDLDAPNAILALTRELGNDDLDGVSDMLLPVDTADEDDQDDPDEKGDGGSSDPSGPEPLLARALACPLVLTRPPDALASRASPDLSAPAPVVVDGADPASAEYRPAAARAPPRATG